jgi:Flp pilus assembly protein TadG
MMKTVIPLSAQPLRPSQRAGQSLVEFVMVMPILLLIMLGAFFIGLAMYQGATASQAMKAPLTNKVQLADTAGNTQNQVLQLINSTNIGALQQGQAVDGLNVVGGPNQLTSVLVGSKTYQAPIPFIPPMTFTVAQAINTNLIQPNGGASGPFNATPGIASMTYPAPTPGLAVPNRAALNLQVPRLCNDPLVYNIAPLNQNPNLVQYAAVIVNMVGAQLPAGPQMCAEVPVNNATVQFSSARNY